MTVGGDAFDDRLNKFNPSMNRGYRLSKWFVGEFGSTQCQAITGCDFSDPKGVSDYVEGDRIARCRAIGCRVAEKARAMLTSRPATPPLDGTDEMALAGSCRRRVMAR